MYRKMMIEWYFRVAALATIPRCGSIILIWSGAHTSYNERKWGNKSVLHTKQSKQAKWPNYIGAMFNEICHDMRHEKSGPIVEFLD
jgi:hypothetical protein